MKKAICLVMFMLMILGGSAWGADIGVNLNGVGVTMDSSTGTPYMDPAGRVMVPLRVVLEKAGAHVEYDTVNRLATVTTVDTEVIVPIGQSFVVVNHVNKTNDAPAKIVNGRTYLPIRIVMESLGYKVGWDSVASKVLIEKPGNVTPPVTVTTTPSASVTTPSDNALMVPNTVGNSSINLYNGGMMARENNWLYYVNFDDNERIWRVDVKTGTSNRVSTGKSRSINVVDGWVYYRQQGNTKVWELHKTKGDGTGDELINDYGVNWLMVSNGYLYYYQTEPKGFYSRKLTSESSTLILQVEMTGVSLQDSKVTFTDMLDRSDSSIRYPGNILQYNVDGSGYRVLSDERTGENDPHAAVVGKYLLYSSHTNYNYLYRFDTKDSTALKLTSREVSNFTGDDSAYYTLYKSEPSGLFKIRPDGKGETQITPSWKPSDVYDPSLHMIGRYIYYVEQKYMGDSRWIRIDKDTGEMRTMGQASDFVENE